MYYDLGISNINDGFTCPKEIKVFFNCSNHIMISLEMNFTFLHFNIISLYPKLHNTCIYFNRANVCFKVKQGLQISLALNLL